MLIFVFSYAIESRIGKDAPKLSLGARTAVRSRPDSAPGPGAYQPTPLKSKAGVKIQRPSDFYHDHHNPSPGPMAYSLPSQFDASKKRGFTMKGRHKETQKRVSNIGPGHYAYCSDF